MDAQTLLRTNAAKAGELVLAIGDAAGAVAKAIEGAAGPFAEMIEERAESIAKTVEEKGAPVVGAVGTKVDALAKTVEERAVPIAGAVGTTVEAVGTTVGSLADDLEERFEKARTNLVSRAKNFKFGTREGIILGIALGVFAAVWLIRRMDRQAARRRLRAAGSRVGERTQMVAGRVGEATQGLTSRVGEATQGLTEKAGALASQAGERVGQVAQTVGARAGEVLQQVRGQGDQAVEEAKLRLSDATAPVREVVISESPRRESAGGMNAGDTDAAVSDGPSAVAAGIDATSLNAGSNLDEATQAAINDAVQEVERVQEAALEEAQSLGLSNGMKVVAFDGTDIGRVQEVREDVFVLDRPKGPDLLVPLTEVARIEGTVAYLRIETGQVTKMGWERADNS